MIDIHVINIIELKIKNKMFKNKKIKRKTKVYRKEFLLTDCYMVSSDFVDDGNLVYTVSIKYENN